jgi:hypothetical protein
VKLVEPETAPLGKSAKKMFDPKLFLAAVGAGTRSKILQEPARVWSKATSRARYFGPAAAYMTNSLFVSIQIKTGRQTAEISSGRYQHVAASQEDFQSRSKIISMLGVRAGAAQAF